MSQFFFDHTFTVDKSHKFLRSLEGLGFTLDKREVEHPGKAFCRFIMFESPKPGRKSYLEFVWIKKRKQTEKMPGISFGISNRLEAFYEQIRSKIPARYHHKNYDWKTDSVSRLPGWNFLTFSRPPMTSYFPWMTEYEADIKRDKKKTSAPRHKNTAYQIIGVELLANSKGLNFYKELFGWNILEKPKLSPGFSIYAHRAGVNKYKRVILACRSMKTFIKVAAPDEMIEFDGKSAALIRNPGFGWDVVVVEV